MVELDEKALEAAAISISGAPFPSKRSIGKAEAAIRAYLSALPAPDDAGPPFKFDRYINGQMMAEGVTIEHEMSLDKAVQNAARIASKGPNGEAPVLVLRHTEFIAELRSALTQEGER